MSTPHNKLIEEKVQEYLALPPSSRQSHVDWLRTALSDLLSTREAQMIEAVEKAYYDSGLRISALFERDEKLCIEVGDATPEVVSIIDNRKFLDALAALRSQHLSN